MPANPSPRAAWPSNDDQTLFNLIVITAGVCLGSYLLWTNFHGQISAGVIGLRHFEIRLFAHFTDRFEQADAQMLQANPYRVRLGDLYGISHAIGRVWRIPACVFIALLGLVCMLRAAPSRFKRAFDLDALAREQAGTFGCTAAFVARKLKLVLPASKQVRPADYALTAEEWIERYATSQSGSFDDGRAREALQRQLGPRWSGPEAASPAVRVMFAALALHHAERRQDAIDLLELVSAALAEDDASLPDGPVEPLAMPAEAVAHATALTNDPAAFKDARDIAGRHAHTSPALMSLLNAARRRHGVLAPAQFAWLKLVDRPLWYALHSLGFETEGTGRYLHPNPRVEALGARDHWAVECAAGEPLFEPDLERAVTGLKRHIPQRGSVLPLRRRSCRCVEPGCHSLGRPAGWPWSRRRGDGVVNLELPADARVQIFISSGGAMAFPDTAQIRCHPGLGRPGHLCKDSASASEGCGSSPSRCGGLHPRQPVRIACRSPSRACPGQRAAAPG